MVISLLTEKESPKPLRKVIGIITKYISIYIYICINIYY